MTQSRIQEIAKNLEEVEARILAAVHSAGRSRSEVTLVAVSKTFPVSDAHILYDLGVRNFGENRDQEGSEKAPQLPEDARWHFQGQIQSRKIPSILGWADVIHSLDSLEHAEKFAQRGSSSHEFFLQVNLDPASTHRGGVAPDEIESFLKLSAVEISGLMVVPPLEMEAEVGFRTVRVLAEKFGLARISMGMSGDFEKAILEGATHIRVGSSILGSRPPLT